MEDRGDHLSSKHRNHVKRDGGSRAPLAVYRYILFRIEILVGGTGGGYDPEITATHIIIVIIIMSRLCHFRSPHILYSRFLRVSFRGLGYLRYYNIFENFPSHVVVPNTYDMQNDYLCIIYHALYSQDVDRFVKICLGTNVYLSSKYFFF